jgi:Family of unknown function (DUF5336)
MTYSPGPPGSSGYPPGSYGAPSPSYAPGEPAPSKLPLYLTIAVAVLGIAAYVASFGPLVFVNLGSVTIAATGGGPNNSSILLTLGSVLASLLAGIGLLPRTKSYPTVVAVLAVLGFLAVIEQMVNRPQLLLPTGPLSTSIAWGLWLVLAFVVLQAIAAVLVLLFDTGVLNPPAPKPRYDPAPPYGQYGQYGAPAGGYYNPLQNPLQNPGQNPVQMGQPLGAPQPGPRPGYPSPFSGAYPPSPSAAGYGSFGPQGPAQQGQPTPPTGYLGFSPPPAVGAGQHRATNPNIGPSYPSPQSSDPSSGSSSSGSSSS